MGYVPRHRARATPHIPSPERGEARVMVELCVVGRNDLPSGCASGAAVVGCCGRMGGVADLFTVWISEICLAFVLICFWYLLSCICLMTHAFKRCPQGFQTVVKSSPKGFQKVSEKAKDFKKVTKRSQKI